MSPSSPLGHRIAERFWDTVGSAWGDWTYLCYDERWRLVAEFTPAADPDAPHTQYVHHNAGVDGMGGSSYIDAVVLRDRDTDATPGGGSPDERRYYVQNWRSDVVALTPELEPDGDPSVKKGAEMVRYTPYGTPIGINPADFNLSHPGGDGVLNSSDSTDFLNAYSAWTGGGSYDVRVDWFRFDETKDSADFLGFNNAYAGPARGRGTLSGIGNRLGYAGYVYDDAIGMHHCRLRVLHPELGRWTRRDPPEFGLHLSQLYDYATSKPLTMTDWLGGAPSPGTGLCPQPGDGTTVGFLRGGACGGNLGPGTGSGPTFPHPCTIWTNNWRDCISCCGSMGENDIGACVGDCGRRFLYGPQDPKNPWTPVFPAPPINGPTPTPADCETDHRNRSSGDCGGIPPESRNACLQCCDAAMQSAVACANRYYRDESMRCGGDRLCHDIIQLIYLDLVGRLFDIHEGCVSGCN